MQVGATVKYALRLQVTKPAFDLTTKNDRDSLVKQAVTDAEKRDLKQGEYAFFHAGTNLRVVVDFANRLIQIMTAAEYAAAGLPECAHVN